MDHKLKISNQIKFKCNKVGERIRIDAPVIEISSEEFPACQNYGQSSDLHYDTTPIKKIH